jgi:5-hydroxyisourate hydrolase-like protein (transthyretin family)
MNRILRRPMFRTGGSAEGITSGLAPRQGYKDANLVEQLTTQKSIIDALAPRQPRQDRSMSNFLIDFGLDIASRPPSGGIFATAAAAAKDPFANFQKAKQIEQAYGAQETEADRALIADMIKGMDDDKLSALMKDVKAGVEAGEFATEAEGIKLLLRKKIYGVLPMEGEAENARIREIELMISRDQEVPAGMINSVAQHIYKIETNAYPEDVQVDLNRTKTFIKPKHIAGVKKDEDGEIIEIVLDPKQAPPRTYNVGQIYFEPQTGELFKNVSKQGEAPRFVKVIFE